jgi:hypothetical protein
MVTEVQYTNIQRVLDDLMEHPMLADLTLEQVVRYTVRFISKHGYNKLYQDKVADIEIHDYRGLLPCDVISIVQVKDTKNGLCLRSMTDSFYPKDETFRHTTNSEHSFKTQGRVIYTSFSEGMVTVAYKATKVDDDGFPMLIDNEVYLDALEAYITLKVYTAKFRSGKIASGILQEIQQSYAVAAKLLETEFSTPSVSEMESMTRYFNSLIPRVKEFDRGFKHLSDRQIIKKH